MDKGKKESSVNSLLVFVILVVLTTVGVLVETNIELSVLGQLIIKGSYLGLVFALSKSLNGKLIKQLFSMPLMSIMVFLFFLSIAIATGVETYYDTTTAQKVIYHAKWFEWIIFMLFINLTANIVRYSLFKKDKVGSFIFHLSFLVIVAGAFVTRNYGFEGMMSIPEGQASNYILSSETYLQIKIDDSEQQYTYDLPMLISEHTNNSFNHKLSFAGVSEPINIQYKDFIPGYLSQDTLKTVVDGDKFLHIVTVGDNGRKNNYLKDGTLLQDGVLKLTFNNSSETDAIKIVELDSGFYVMSPYDLNYLQMSDQSEGVIIKDSLQRFFPMRLYSVGGVQFVFKQVFENAELEKIEIDHSPLGSDNLVLNIFQGDKSKTVYLPGGKGLFPEVQSFEFLGLNYRLNFGSKVVQVPFSIYLRDFQLENYPGTKRPSSYASEVTVMDGDKNIERRIFMNNVLDYGGYRFFQSSYNISDAGESTVLSVNHDAMGTWITYIGYALMSLGFFLSIFLKDSRFVFLLKKSSEVRVKRENLKMLIFFIGLSSSMFSFGQHEGHNHEQPVNFEIADYIPIDKKHADDFGYLIIQDFEGRFKPVHTTAVDILKKVSRQETYNGMSAMQVFVGLHTDFQYWFDQPMIYISGDSTEALLGEIKEHRAKMSDFYDKNGTYKLGYNMEVALAKDPGRRNVFEKNIVKTDERFSILRGVVMGFYLKIFPVKTDLENKWYSPADNVTTLRGDDSLFVNGIMTMYVYAVHDAREKSNWTEADKILNLIDTYQQNAGNNAIMPTREKIEWEITYNKMNLFKHLSNLYLIIGLFLLIIQFIQIFNPNKSYKWPMRIGVFIFFVFWLAHGYGLGLRWYLSGHAPWSNGYEAIVFIGFITALAGLLFSKQSKIVVGATGILTWLMLFVAHMNNMDPQITPLVPVLKSYWLMIHVAIITGSYGFLGLSAMLGIINLFIDIFKTKTNIKRLRLTSKELRYINEMSMTIGLFMLTIGTFLGGIWANESWGRYWGWDAKETWALASVLVYTIILHFRFIPGMKSDYTFNFCSLWGYSSIIMTFYGVNYYLAGMHSYATGEPVPIPYWVPLTVFLFFTLSLLAWLRKRKFD
jgi:cytochrome c-type biogenesis protein CcsB